MQPDPVKQSSKAIDQVKEASDQVKAAPESLKEAAKSVQEQLHASLDAFLDRLPLLGASLAIIAVTWILSRGIQTVLAWLLGHSPVSESKQVLISRGAAVLVWGLGILLAIVVAFPGLSTSKAFGILAIGSVAFGFAFRDLAENMFAGVVLLSQFPFDHGDFIDSGATSGTVEEVTFG